MANKIRPNNAQGYDIRVDADRLRIAMAIAKIQTDEELAKRSNISARTLRNIRNSGTCSFEVLRDLAVAMGRNPMDLLVTPGFPDPKMGSPGRPFSIDDSNGQG
jgi:hypothetical protein